MDIGRWLRRLGLPGDADQVKVACIAFLVVLVALLAIFLSGRLNSPPPADERSPPRRKGFMDCEGAAVCGLLTLESGLGTGVYKKWPPNVHGLWPQTPPFGNSACRAPTLSAASPNAAAACFDDFDFQLHEWRKHGVCAGARSAADFFRQVCSLAAHPLQLMERAGRDFDAQWRALKAAGLAIFNVDTRNFQFQLSACAGCDGVWVLTPQSAFGKQ
eukprot:EG_transcript_27725